MAAESRPQRGSGGRTREERATGVTWRMTTFAALLALLMAMGASPAAAFDPPTVLPSVPAIGSTPNSITIRWEHFEQGVHGYTVERENPYRIWPDVNAAQRDLLDVGLQPSTTYRYKVCAYFLTEDGDSECSEWEEGETSPPETAAQGTPANPPIISGVMTYQNDVDVRWYTEPKYDYDRIVVRYRVKPSGAEPNPAFGQVRDDGGVEGSTRVSGLVPRVTYLFSVQGCYDIVFEIAGEECTDFGDEYETITSPVQSVADRDPLVIQRHEAGETWIALYWDAPSDFGYSTYEISYREKSGTGRAGTEAAPGDFPSHTVGGLEPGTSYVFRVRGCDFDLGLYDPNDLSRIGPSGMNCDVFGPEYEARTNAPPAGTFGTAMISLSQPTVTAGNTVEVKGSVWRENIGTAVQLTLSGPGGTVQLGSAQIDRGAFSATVTIPAGTRPGDYTVLAESPGAKAEASLQVIAPSRTGTLTVTWVGSGEVSTDIEANVGPYALSGANFAPGPLTIFLDSPTGSQLGSATVGGNGTFRREFTIRSSDVGGKYGPHKLVVVQNGAVTGEIAVTVQPEYVIR